MDLSTRAALPELMDAADLDIGEYKKCLTDLTSVNRVTLTHRCSLQFLQCATKGLPKGSTIRILDLAFGHGDLLRAIARWGTRRGFVMSLVGVDLNPRSAQMAREATPSNLQIDFRVADVFDFTPAESPHFIVSSQFTHHLADGQIMRLLQWMDTNAIRGWHVADLHRHAFPYYGFRVLCRVMRWHWIVRYDGTVSIARSFRKADWQRYLAATGLQASITWHPLFRYAVSRLK
jgi:2-polyprenyl-3-methyl-5-hydroxy-6-metoxy-1,4-benzoquinol methylase